MAKELTKELKAFLALIKSKEYQTNLDYRFPERNQYFSTVEGSLKGWRQNTFNTVRTFEIMIEEMDRYPTELEYLNRCYDEALPQFIKMFPKMNTEPFLKAFRAFCDKRYAYTYSSKMSEEFTALQLMNMYPEDRVYADKYIDTIAGIDILLVHNGKYYPIHITSEYGASASKGTNSMNYKNGDKKIHLQDVIGATGDVLVNYPRDFSAHVTFAYSRKENYKNVVINNIPLFKAKYIKESLNEFHQIFEKELLKWGSEEAVHYKIEKVLHNTGYFNNYRCAYLDGAETKYAS